jgi:asparagine synthase (glutamine-hydrolysing)
MCGICGFANYRNDLLLKGMTARLTHRGPDEDGFFTSGEKVSLGMRRLKIIDLATGSQPISNEDGTATVVFNGEIYNFKELRSDLRAKGHRFRTGADTEVLVHLYEEYGPDFPARLRGMFAFALWDSKTDTLFLGRDHFGIKPLFYAFLGDKLFFASEIKSLLLAAEIPDDLDPSAIDAYFTRLYIPSPLTVYKHIRKLEPAQTLVFRGGRARIKAYWRLPDYASAGARDEREYLEGIDDLLGKSVSEQLVSDVPIGLLLSGGMDSSSALYYMSRASGAPVKTFTVGYGAEDASFNETAGARLLAAHFQTEHYETFPGTDPCAVMEKLAEQFDEPFADASAIPTYLVTREAKKKVTVALSGIGGDELFGGYPRHLGARLLPAYLKLPGLVREGLWAGFKYVPESSASWNLPGRFKRFVNGGRGDFRTAYESWISFFTREEREKLRAPGLPAMTAGPEHTTQGRLERPDDIFAFEVRNYLSDDLLCLADRASMSNSLELRVPFLDVRLAEFMSGAPLALKTRGFRLKYLLKKVMAGRLPGEILQGGKQGFQVPLARWYKEELNAFARELLRPAALKRSGYLSPDYVAAMLKEHESGRRNLNDQLHAVVMFELWLKKRRAAASAKILSSAAQSPGKNILLLNMAGLGDIVMMTPFLRALKSAYPDSKVCLLTIDRSADLASHLSGLDEVFSVPVRYRLPSPAGLWRFFKSLLALRAKNFDLLLNLQPISSRAGAWKMRLINAFVRPGFSVGRSLLPEGAFYDFVSREAAVEDKNEVELIAKLLEPLGVKLADFYVDFPVSQEQRGFAVKELARLGFDGKKLIGFNPGAFRPSRRWPLENWAELARLLLNKYPGVGIFISGSPAEAKDYAPLRISDRVVVSQGSYNMGQLAAILEKLDLFVTNDTGPMHLAAAVGTRVAAIFGPGDFHRFAPSVPKERRLIIRKDVPGCAIPCYKFNCPDPVCLKGITPAEVFGAVEGLLDAK